jgi:hypothetical protein
MNRFLTGRAMLENIMREKDSKIEELMKRLAEKEQQLESTNTAYKEQLAVAGRQHEEDLKNLKSHYEKKIGDQVESLC